jgi:hypothetical protein
VVCIFLYFIKSSVECTLHLYIEFLIIFYFKVYQAVICSTVLSPVSLTPVKNLLAVSLKPGNSL